MGDGIARYVTACLAGDVSRILSRRAGRNQKKGAEGSAEERKKKCSKYANGLQRTEGKEGKKWRERETAGYRNGIQKTVSEDAEETRRDQKASPSEPFSFLFLHRSSLSRSPFSSLVILTSH